jgi:hypothetical protein
VFVVDERPRLLDLFCCSGGATRGYQMAGFHVTGVDIAPQPNYCGDAFIEADALEVDLSGYDFIHASPPCQGYSALNAVNKRLYQRLIAPTRRRLLACGTPFVIENVLGSPLHSPVTLCGEMFGLAVIRHRLFEAHGFELPQPAHVKHRGRVRGWRHGEYFDGPYVAVYGDGGGKGSVKEWQDAMGIDWTGDRREIAEAIPPAYTRCIGEAALVAVEGLRAA